MRIKLCFFSYLLITALIIFSEVSCQLGVEVGPSETETTDQIPDETYSLCSGPNRNAPANVNVVGKLGMSQKGEKTVFAKFTIGFKPTASTKSLVTLTRALKGCVSESELDTCVRKPTFKTRFDCNSTEEGGSSKSKSSCPLTKGKKYTITFNLRFDQSQIPQPRLSSFWLNRITLKDGNRVIFCTTGNFTVNYIQD